MGGEGMASWQKILLLPDDSQGMPAAGPGPGPSWHNLFALRLQCRLSQLLPLLVEAMECGKTSMVLSAYGAWLSNNTGSSLRTFDLMRRYSANVHGGMMAPELVSSKPHLPCSMVTIPRT